MTVDSLHFEPPRWRRLRAYAFDPSLDLDLDTAVANQTFIRVPWESVQPGPVGEYVEVIDLDPFNNCCYEPVNLNEPSLLAQDGLMPSTGLPQFHQQMVYAVAMTTIKHFERALGRTVLWTNHYEVAPDSKKVTARYVQRLRIYPHAMPEENAYYDPDRVALLFGYFRAQPRRTGRVLPQGLVFTCLSHDVITHETTHAILDGLHPYFSEASNPDVLAFHEAFADIVALFQHFTFPEVLKHQIAKTCGDLRQENLLAQLAQEFGQGTGQYGALRDALGANKTGEWKATQAESTDYRQLNEPHYRGAALVGAVFDAFNSVYRRRTADLMRLASGGTGVLADGALHPDLVGRLANEAATTAEYILHMCIRALDYCPPLDITFGEFLRALVTADYDYTREDGWAYRTAMIEAFRRRGIYPSDVQSLSESSLHWHCPTPDEQLRLTQLLIEPVRQIMSKHLSKWALDRDRENAWQASQAARALLRDSLQIKISASDSSLCELLGLDFSRDEGFDVHSVRPARRVSADGQQKVDLVIELTQSLRQDDSGKGKWWFRGGSTLLLDLEALQKLDADVQVRRKEDLQNIKLVRYSILKRVNNEQRREQQAGFISGELNGSLDALYFGGSRGSVLEAPFAMVHRAAALEGR